MQTDFFKFSTKFCIYIYVYLYIYIYISLSIYIYIYVYFVYKFFIYIFEKTILEYVQLLGQQKSVRNIYEYFCYFLN